MFGAIIRAAAAFVGAMLLSSVVREFLEPFVLPMLKDSLGEQSLIYQSLHGVMTWLPLLVAVALAVGLIARGITESRLPG